MTVGFARCNRKYGIISKKPCFFKRFNSVEELIKYVIDNSYGYLMCYTDMTDEEKELYRKKYYSIVVKREGLNTNSMAHRSTVKKYKKVDKDSKNRDNISYVDEFMIERLKQDEDINGRKW